MSRSQAWLVGAISLLFVLFVVGFCNYEATLDSIPVGKNEQDAWVALAFMLDLLLLLAAGCGIAAAAQALRKGTNE